MATATETSSAFSMDRLPESIQEYAQTLLNDSSESPSGAYDSLEAKIRSHWLECLADSSTDQLQTLFTSFWKFCIAAVESNEDKLGVYLRKLPFILLEDAVDVLLLTKLLEFWDATVDTSTLCSGVLWNTTTTSSHVLQWIRCCNSLLRKLSFATPNPSTAGRILMDLAQVLPLHDRSSLKQWGSVSSHPHDGTGDSYYQDEDDYDEELQQTSISMPEIPTPLKDSVEPHFQYSLYETFWSVQKDFSNPYAISFTTFLPNMRTILATLESQSILSKSRSGGSGVSDPLLPTSTLEYLTRGRLLPIQLQDPMFCRHILTQYLIVEAFVSSQSSQLQSTLRDLTTRAKALLESSSGGKEHLQTLHWLLSERESMWRNWKKNKCKPDMEMHVEENDKMAEKGKRTSLNEPLGSKTATPDTLFHDKPLSMDELAVISKGMREAVPDVYTFLEDYVDALDPDAGIEEEYHPKNDKLFSWRAMRLLSRGHLPMFGMVQKSNGDFEQMVRHIYEQEKKAEVPGEAPGEEVIVDYDVDTAAKNAGAENPKKEGDVEMNDQDESNASVGGVASEEEEDEVPSPSSAEDGDEKVNEFEKTVVEEEEELHGSEDDNEGEAKAEPAKKEAGSSKKDPSKPTEKSQAASTASSKRKRAASNSPESAPRGGDHPSKRRRGEEPRPRTAPGGDFRGGGRGRGGGAGRGRRRPNFEPARRPVEQPNAPGRGPPPQQRGERRGGDDERRRQNSGGHRDNRRRTY